MDTKPLASSQKHPDSENTSVIITACVIGILMGFLVYLGIFIFGSHSGHYFSHYFKTTNSIPPWIPISVLILIGLAAFMGKKYLFLHEKTTLLGCFLIAIFIQILIHSVYPIPMGIIVQNDESNGFYSLAMKYSPFQVLSQYKDLVASFPDHARTNMPGKILIFQLFRLITVSPQRMGYLVIICSTIGALLIYGICKKLFHDERAAFYAFWLYVLIPGKLFFIPIPNTITPVFILLSLYLFLWYLEKKNYLFLWLLGFSLYILVLFEPSPLITGVIFIGILLNAIGEKRFLIKDIWVLILLPILAFLCAYAIFRIIFSFDLLGAFQYVMNDAVNFNLETGRGYWVWFGENLKEFLYSVGTPVMIIFIYWISKNFSQWRTKKWNILLWSREDIYLLGLLFTIGLLVFLGINRGEVTRLWIYLAVLFQIPACLFIAKNPKSTILFCLVAATLVLQTIIGLQRVSFVLPR